MVREAEGGWMVLETVIHPVPLLFSPKESEVCVYGDEHK